MKLAARNHNDLALPRDPIVQGLIACNFYIPGNPCRVRLALRIESGSDSPSILVGFRSNNDFLDGISEALIQ
jgi:hypothetical protein